MPIKYSRLLCLVFLLCLLAGPLAACDSLPSVTINGTPIISTPPGSSLDSATGSLNVWNQVAPGVEVRNEHWKSPGNTEDTVTIVRLDMRRAHLSIGYQSRTPLTLEEWMKQTHARVVMNGGYFDAHNRPTGLLISNGQVYGASYQGFGGMLSVDAQGHIHLRSLSRQPYDPSEQLSQATQSSPMLMENGKRTQFTANAVSDRRSVVAIDKRGRLLLIVSPGQAFTLDEMADLLASSDLSIQTALNLDGGASTGLYVDANNKNQQVVIDAVTTLPIAIIIK